MIRWIPAVLGLSLALATSAVGAAPGGAPSPAGPIAGNYELTQVASGLPPGIVLTAATALPRTQDMIVLARDGRIYRTGLGGAKAKLFGDISAKVVEPLDGEMGLLGIAFSPDYRQDQRVYLYYTAAGNPRKATLARYKVRNGKIDPTSAFIVLRATVLSAEHHGGQLAFGPDGYLYWGLGDAAIQNTAQRLSTLFGKILRLDVSPAGAYKIPEDNPFGNTPNARGEIWAYGFRNPWAFSFDSETDALWAGDVGSASMEEVDRVLKGNNYGWDQMEGTECKIADCSAFTKPRFAYPHAKGNCAVIGGFVYHGKAMPELDGRYLFSDYCAGRVWALTTTGAAKRLELLDFDLNVHSIAQTADGEMLVIAYEKVFKLGRKS